MNKLLTLALLALNSLAVSAAEPTIRVNDLGNVYQVNPDGTEINLGAPYDAITNNPALGSKIQTAAQLRLAQFKAETQAQITAAISAANQARDEAIAVAQAERDTAIAANAAELAAKTARVAALEAHLTQLATYIATMRATIASLGGVTLPPPPAP